MLSRHLTCVAQNFLTLLSGKMTNKLEPVVVVVTATFVDLCKTVIEKTNADLQCIGHCVRCVLFFVFFPPGLRAFSA